MKLKNYFRPLRSYKGYKNNQKGLTLVEILFSIILFVLANVVIISLIITSVDKPRQAGIESVMTNYRTTAHLLLLETNGVINGGDITSSIEEYNNRLDTGYTFNSKVGSEFFKSTKIMNPYGNPYIIDIVTDSTSKRASIVITTQGQGLGQDFKLGVYYLDGKVYTATFGFGRRDRVIGVASEEALALGLTVDDNADGNSDILSITP